MTGDVKEAGGGADDTGGQETRSRRQELVGVGKGSIDRLIRELKCGE